MHKNLVRASWKSIDVEDMVGCCWIWMDMDGYCRIGVDMGGEWLI